MSDRQAVFFLPVDPLDKNHKDPDTTDLRALRHAQYMHEGWKKHQNTVYWVDIQLAQRKGLKFYQTKLNAIILYDTLPAFCIPKAIMMETGEISFEKVCMSPRPPPKISFKDNWRKELGSEVAGGNEHSQQTEPKTKPIVRTVRNVKSEEIDKGVLFDYESTNNVRTVRPVNSCVPVSVELVDKDEDARRRSNGETREWTTSRFVHSARGNRR